jgi:3-oxoacyl-(acyl-carrier-protein) synthase
MACVSAQDTSGSEFDFEKCGVLQESVVPVYKPEYKSYIKPAMIRRMSGGVKNAIVSSSIALNEAGISEPEAIITGSGMGCLKDSEKFLESIINNDEQYLTPTSFIQSTHNTVGAQIALALECKSYNVTYVHQANSFESSLIDTMLMIDEGATPVLVGGVDEIGPHSTRFHKLVGHIKEKETLQNGLLNSGSEGAVFSEGAQFFVIGEKETDKTRARLEDVAIYDHLKKDEVESSLHRFLNENKLQVSDIDMVVLGINGDIRFDDYYHGLRDNIFASTLQIYYKHLSGEYNTASAFGFWTACKLLESQSVPEILKLNHIETGSIYNVLLYNQYLGKSHSFTLLKKAGSSQGD